MNARERGEMLTGKLNEVLRQRLEGVEHGVVHWGQEEGVILENEIAGILININTQIKLRNKAPKSKGGKA